MSQRAILYLCGPMSGLPEDNYPAFNDAAARLRRAGYSVINPAETTLPRTAPWVSHMRKDLADMVNTADAVATLPGWENSRGARIEVWLSYGLGWPVASVDEWLHISVEQQAEASEADQS